MTDWSKVAMFCSIFIVFLFGFLGGYGIHKNSECVKNPLTYGVKVLEKSNDGMNFTCSCMSPKYATFFFDDAGLYEENPLFKNIEFDYVETD